MTETLEVLLELQKVDDEIRVSEEARDSLPKKIAEYDERMNEMEHEINEEREQLNELQKERRRLERELTISENSRKTYESQLLEVTTAREYTALQHEIDAEKRKSAQMEEEILNLMDLIEEKAKHIEEKEKAFSAEDKDIRAKKDKLQAEYDSIDDTLKKQYEGRKKVLINVRPDILSQYDRIWRSRRTPVVVPIKKNACSGCFRALPPQEINEARKRERLLTCEACGRIIYWPEETRRFV